VVDIAVFLLQGYTRSSAASSRRVLWQPHKQPCTGCWTLCAMQHVTATFTLLMTMRYVCLHSLLIKQSPKWPACHATCSVHPAAYSVYVLLTGMCVSPGSHVGLVSKHTCMLSNVGNDH
jgi:hypothetical protein